jgi:hypothetical protein
MGGARSLAQRPCGPADRSAVLCPARPDSRTAVLSRRGSCPTGQSRDHSRGTSAASAASAPACPRGRDVARRRTARGHIAATGACRPRGHVRVLARHRQHRGRARRPRAPGPDDPRRQRAAAHALSQTSQRAAPSGAAHRARAGRARAKAVINPPPGDASTCFPLEASVRGGWRESSKRSSASVGADAPFRGKAQAGLDLLRRAERSSAVGDC